MKRFLTIVRRQPIASSKKIFSPAPRLGPSRPDLNRSYGESFCYLIFLFQKIRSTKTLLAYSLISYPVTFRLPLRGLFSDAGFPDFHAPAEIREAAVRALRAEHGQRAHSGQAKAWPKISERTSNNRHYLAWKIPCATVREFPHILAQGIFPKIASTSFWVSASR